MPILEIRDISKSFGGVRAVHSCSFALEEKKITALIGPNGAGKTTLFNIVNGFLAQDAGSVIFRNVEISKYRAWQRSRLGMSRTFQLSRLFRNLSLRDNLLLAAREDDDRFFRNLIRPTPDAALISRLEETLAFVGLRKDLDTPITDLSYGEQKLFDLARALLNPHTLLLFDEPVAGVNPVLRDELKNLLRKLRANNETILLIEHDMDFVRSVADRVIVMDQGTVLTEGEPGEVLRDKRVLEAYLGTKCLMTNF